MSTFEKKVSGIELGDGLRITGRGDTIIYEATTHTFVGDVGLELNDLTVDDMTVGDDLTVEGDIVGDVTGNVTGNLTGNVTGNVTGNITGQITGDAAVTAVLAGTTGVTNGRLRRGLVKLTVPHTLFVAAATTQDLTLFSLPAKYRIVSVMADTTTKFIGTGIGTAEIRLGTAAGGEQLLVDHDVFTAAVVVGDADADLGTEMTRAGAIQGGYLPSWTGATSISLRMTTDVNMGDAAATVFTQGSVTVYLVFEALA